MGGEGKGVKKGLTGRDTLDAAPAREAADGGLGDALDVVAEDLAVAFRAAFAEAFAAFSACEGGGMVLVDLMVFVCFWLVGLERMRRGVRMGGRGRGEEGGGTVR